MKKSFPTRVILTVTTGILLTKGSEGDNGIGDLYQILGWMTDDEPYTHQLGRFSEECKPALMEIPEIAAVSSEYNVDLLKQMGQWAKENSSEFEQAFQRWLQIMEQEHGLKDSYEVGKVSRHKQIDPITEIVGMMSK